MTKVFIYNEDVDQYYYVELAETDDFRFEADTEIPRSSPGKLSFYLRGTVSALKQPSPTAFKSLLKELL